MPRRIAAKHLVRSVLLFWGLIALFPLSYGLFEILTLYIHDRQCCADGQATITTWLDSNADGVRQDSEQPLSGVCVGEAYGIGELSSDAKDPCQGDRFTDDSGKWGEFLPGNDCGPSNYTFASAPDGYRLTTNGAIESCTGEFGFIPEDAKVSGHTLTMEEIVQRETLKLRIRNIAVGCLIVVIAVLGTVWLQKDEVGGQTP